MTKAIDQLVPIWHRTNEL